jgi:hypothetical protein
MVFGIGMWQVYLSEEVFANAILTETLLRGGVKPDGQVVGRRAEKGGQCSTQ